MECRLDAIKNGDIAPTDQPRKDANLELLASDRHEQKLPNGESDDYGESWGFLCDSGGDARVNGIAFDERQTEPWKDSSMEADIDPGGLASPS